MSKLSWFSKKSRPYNQMSVIVNDPKYITPIKSNKQKYHPLDVEDDDYDPDYDDYD